jgi:tRNA (guanine37-N1)-methyltransferase
MKITILTLFPEMFSGFVSQSIIKRALAKAVVDIQIVNIRDYTKDKYGRVDTPPIGGGAGLIM